MSRSTDLLFTESAPRRPRRRRGPKEVALPTARAIPHAASERADAVGSAHAPLDARRTPATWLPVDGAARALGVDGRTLRRAIAGHARRDADGLVLAEFDGVRARKVGRRWRVLLDRSWLTDEPAAREASS